MLSDLPALVQQNREIQEPSSESTTSSQVGRLGTYFIVWIENNGTTGMANIGDKGDVAFSAGGRMVVVKPGYYSMAVDGAPPPLLPSSLIMRRRSPIWL